MKLQLVIPGIPKPKQSVRSRIVITRSGKQFVQNYQTAEVKQNESNIRAVVLSQLEAGFTPFAGPVIITRLVYVFPPLSSFTKKQKEAIESGEYIPKSTKPDLTDNLNKGLFDALQGIVFLNDSQICEMRSVKKVFGKVPRIELDMEEIIEQKYTKNNCELEEVIFEFVNN